MVQFGILELWSGKELRFLVETLYALTSLGKSDYKSSPKFRTPNRPMFDCFTSTVGAGLTQAWWERMVLEVAAIKRTLI